MKISIITVVANRLKYLKMLMWNLFNYQDLDHSEFEHIIIDDGGIENITSWLMENYLGKNVQYIRTNRKDRRGMPNVPAGRSIPTNLGVKFAKGDIILICDAEDYMLESNHLSEFCKKIGPKQIMSAVPMETGNEKDLIFYEENYKEPIKFKKYLEKNYPDRMNPSNISQSLPQKMDPYGQLFAMINDKVHFLYRCSGYWAQRKEDYTAIGGFDEKAWGMAGDDYELSYRLDAADFTYIPSPLHIVHNFHGRGLERHSCSQVNTEDLIKENEKIREEFFEKINDKTLPIYLKFDPQFCDGDIYIDFSKS